MYWPIILQSQKQPHTMLLNKFPSNLLIKSKTKKFLYCNINEWIKNYLLYCKEYNIINKQNISLK